MANNDINSSSSGNDDDERRRGQKIELSQMSQTKEVWKADDDWTGLTDSQQRRKLQNRLNQRLWRKRHQASNSIRKRKKEAAKGLSPTDKITKSISSSPIKSEPDQSDKSCSPEFVAPQPYHSKRSSSDQSDQSPDSTASTDATSVYSRSDTNTDETDHSLHRQVAIRKGESIQTTCGIDPVRLRNMLYMVETGVLDDQLLGNPRVDKLLTLIQYNVFRGLITNTSAMGFDMAWLDCQALSPYYTSQTKPIECPATLRPTKLQQKVEHHPWIDLLPFPKMRDNMLKLGEDYDDTPLCQDLLEFTDVAMEKKGMILWGEPWDPNAWEVSDGFKKRWGWILEGCWELMDSTNRWRQQRGEKCLYPPKSVQEIRDRAVQEVE